MSAEVIDVSTRTRRKIAARLLPFLTLSYLICYVDRANVSFANLRMSGDLGLSDQMYGLGVSLFYIGYVLFEIPGALIVERWSARKWIARIMFTWGIATILNGFVRTPREFYAVRFLVGIAEASFFPGVIVYLTHWFCRADRAKAIASFYIAVPAASVIGSGAAGFLLGMHWYGLAGWRWIFIVEGIPPLIFGVATLLYLTDWPEQANWLAPAEREWIRAELAAELAAKKRVRSYTIWQAFVDRQILLLIAAYILALTAAQSITYWLPTLMKRLWGLPPTTVALLVALPGLAGIIGMLLNGWHSDATGDRRWHTAVPLACAGVLYLVLPLTSGNVSVGLPILVAAGGFMYSYLPVFWSMPTMVLGESAAAACFGMINSAGQTGSIVGPSLIGYLNQITGSTAASFTAIGLCFLVGAGIVPLVTIRTPPG
jgi:ACS family tartrate transporter-like MFS transporter